MEMRTSSIEELYNSTDRFKLYILQCNSENLNGALSFFQKHGIPAINIGKEISSFIDKLANYRFLNIDVYDFTKNLLESKKTKIGSSGNDVIAIYNPGVLLEPSLELNAVQLLKEFSKSATLIIIWENQLESPDRLNWPTQQQTYFLDFSEIRLKILQNEI
jgi:hypothetical protein